MWHFILSVTILLLKSKESFQQIPIISSSPGIVITEEAGQVLYEANAPIIYQFQAPVWDNFLSLNYGNCRNSTFVLFCNILEKIESIMEEMKIISEPSTFQSFPEETHSSTWGLKCHNIGQHFSSFRVDSGIIQKYLGFLRGCSNGIMLEEELNTDFASNPTLSNFQDLQSTFSTEFLDEFDPNGDLSVQRSIHLNFLDSLLSIGFSSYISQAIGWNSAISNCKNGLIPDQILKPRILLESLRKLNQTASENGWTFSIRPEEEFLPFYFKNKLADCTFSGDIFYIRILVPIIKSTRNWMHISSQSIQFYQKQLEQEFIYKTKSLNKGTYFYEKNSKRLFQSANCEINQPAFCKLPELWDKSLVNEANCISDILENKDVKENCAGEASANIRDFLHLPLILKEGTDIYYLTGLPEQDITIKCQEPDGTGITYKEFAFPQEKGVLKVQLPCFCLIIITEDLELSASAPCYVLNDMLNVTQVWHQDFIM